MLWPGSEPLIFHQCERAVDESIAYIFESFDIHLGHEDVERVFCRAH